MSESLSAVAEQWLAENTDALVRWRRHIHEHPELARQEHATTEYVAARLAEAGLNPKVLPGGTGVTCDFGPEDGPGWRCGLTWMPCRCRSEPVRRIRRRCRMSRMPVGTTRTPRSCWALPWRSIRRRRCRRGAPDLPARRRGHARRRHRRGGHRRDGGRHENLCLAL